MRERERERGRERQRDRETERQRDRETESERERETERDLCHFRPDDVHSPVCGQWHIDHRPQKIPIIIIIYQQYVANKICVM